MLWWSLGLLIVAIVAAVFGYGEIVAGAERYAKILFWICLILSVTCIVIYSYSVPFNYTNYSVP
jgi:uncharacterized membrane protein YtjA (UPF0391 family)